MTAQLGKYFSSASLSTRNGISWEIDSSSMMIYGPVKALGNQEAEDGRQKRQLEEDTWVRSSIAKMRACDGDVDVTVHICN